MIITRLEEYGEKKIKVYIDGDYVFWLYAGELQSYGIREGSVMRKDILASIYKETILIRVKKYALSILERMDRTEFELRKKLLQAGYTEETVDAAVLYVKKYAYMDDFHYAAGFIRNHMLQKSRRYIEGRLLQKGIEKSMIQKAYDSLEDGLSGEGGMSPETAAIKKEIQKRTKNLTEMTLKDKQRLFALLCRKGFDYDMIHRELALLQGQDFCDEPAG